MNRLVVLYLGATLVTSLHLGCPDDDAREVEGKIPKAAAGDYAVTMEFGGAGAGI